MAKDSLSILESISAQISKTVKRGKKDTKDAKAQDRKFNYDVKDKANDNKQADKKRAKAEKKKAKADKKSKGKSVTDVVKGMGSKMGVGIGAIFGRLFVPFKLLFVAISAVIIPSLVAFGMLYWDEIKEYTGKAYEATSKALSKFNIWAKEMGSALNDITTAVYGIDFSHFARDTQNVKDGIVEAWDKYVPVEAISNAFVNFKNALSTVMDMIHESTRDKSTADKQFGELYDRYVDLTKDGIKGSDAKELSNIVNAINKITPELMRDENFKKSSGFDNFVALRNNKDKALNTNEWLQ